MSLTGWPSSAAVPLPWLWLVWALVEANYVWALADPVSKTMLQDLPKESGKLGIPGDAPVASDMGPLQGVWSLDRVSSSSLGRKSGVS